MSKLVNRAKTVGLGIYLYVRSLRVVISGNSCAGEKALGYLALLSFNNICLLWSAYKIKFIFVCV